ncbi:MAG: peptide chain release factor N(5)-glutamine methyltransferase [Candidatus Saganbacteria bacterium]|nr:peptide chain release factor N(5)-glutamine methyltransferase [Candidatus Saganbacteria bacterium]
MNIKEVLAATSDYLRKHEIESPSLESEILLASATGLKRIELYTNFERELSREILDKFKVTIRRRLKNEPISYIVGNQAFMSLDFFVDNNVLVPRPETELLVEKSIDIVTSSKLPVSNFQIADIGTGSGCISISLAKYLPAVMITATESSPRALDIAKKNAKHHQVESKIEFLQGDFLEPLKDKKFDLLVSNPPYIPTKDIETLMPDVRNFEPHQALNGGPEGLDFIRKLITDGPKHSDTIIFEFGFGQADAIRKLCLNVKILKDYSGIERIAICKNK